MGFIRLKQIKEAKQLVDKVSKIENTIKNIANPSLDGYEKPSETSAVTENDSLQAAIGKIEKALDGKQSAGNYAPVDSPSLTGTPIAPTADAGTNTAQIATTAFVMGALSTLINSAPETLDTLKELAEALGNDPNFSATVMNLIGQKLDKSGGTVTGDLTVNGTIKGNVTGNVSGSSGSCTGNAATATKLATARTINIQDSTATNTGTGASFDGSGNATIKLPAAIKANLTGNVTGNCSGSSGSCTGNAATATKINGKTIAYVESFNATTGELKLKSLS